MNNTSLSGYFAGKLPAATAMAQIAEQAVNRRLAAGVNLIPALSMYRWKGNIKRAVMGEKIGTIVRGK